MITKTFGKFQVYVGTTSRMAMSRVWVGFLYFSSPYPSEDRVPLPYPNTLLQLKA